MRAMPSPAERTRPTLTTSSPASYRPISRFRIPVISLMSIFTVHRVRKPRERIRGTGLSAAEAGGYARSCFEASSADHPEFRTTRNPQGLYHPSLLRQDFYLHFS